MFDQFSRTRLLLGDDAMDALARARVAVFGIGGVGSYAAEALARSGVGALDLVDHDQVSLTNINRQIVALESTVGMNKADVMAARIADINPRCTVTPHVCFFLPDTADQIDLAQFDYIVDAVDTVTAKLEIIVRAQKAGVPVISSMGTGNKLDPSRLRISDIYETRVDPLARVMRRELRQRGILHAQVLWAPGEPEKPAETDEAAPAGRRSIPGSISWVPAAAGLKLAAHVVLSLALQSGPTVID